MADIVSTATMSESPLVRGALLREGQHLDLVGSFKLSMREADDEAISRCRIYIDSDAAFKESGDLITPLANGTIVEDQIVGTLFDLCSGQIEGRQDNEITCFKSVGHALEDLVAAGLAKDRKLR